MERILLIHWNKSTGPEPIIQYPPEKTFPPKELFLKIWAQHELNKEDLIIKLGPIGESKKIYYSVIQEHESETYFLILVYKNDKKINFITPEILAIIGKNLIELINTNKITLAIAEAFNTIKNYSQVESEKLIEFFTDQIKYTILQILKEGIISKNELIKTLRNEYGFSTINIDLLLITFLKENLIKKEYVAGSGECYYLIKDLTFCRIPPKNVVSKIKDDDVLNAYKEELSKIFDSSNYCREIEDKNLTEFLIDSDVFHLIKTLRKQSVSVSECINLLNNRDELLERKIIFEAKGNIYLLSNICFIKFTPYYILKNLTKRLENNSISLNQYIIHSKYLLNQLSISKTFLDYQII
ncbi:MAG: hypothetical protein ACTSUL_07645 [Promethearchaeota archaeon]